MVVQKKYIMIMLSCVLALVPLNSCLALDFSLKAKIQTELDSNPFLKEQKIKLKVLKEENGYVTIEMSEGNKQIREDIKNGTDIHSAQFENKWLTADATEDEKKTANALKKSLGYIQKMDGVKELLVTASLDSKEDKAEKLIEQSEQAKKNKDYPRAIQLLQQAIELDSLKARYELGKMYVLGREIVREADKGIELLRQAAEQGFSSAQSFLGNGYYSGRDFLRQDKQEAAKWLQKAADQGEMDAQILLGHLYKRGEGGVKQDNAKANELYVKAFEKNEEGVKKGYKFQKFKSIDMHSKGLGTPRDYGKALKILNEFEYDSGYEMLQKPKLAWLYATAEDPKFLDGKKAVQLASVPVQKQPDSIWLNAVLAAAYARDNQFDKAIVTQQKAVELMQKEKMDDKNTFVILAQKQLALYKNKQPYVYTSQDY